MLGLFQELVTPEQKRLTIMVERNGGAVAALESKQVMRELEKAERDFTAPLGSGDRPGEDRPLDVVTLQRELQHEINCDPSEAIEKNTEFFDRKFDVQRREIKEDIARALNREGDRIISAVTAGPHDRIVDPVRCEVFSYCIG